MEKPLATSRYVKPGEAARSIGRSRAFIYQRIATGEIRAVKLAGAIRIPSEAWEAWLLAVVEPLTPTVVRP